MTHKQEQSIIVSVKGPNKKNLVLGAISGYTFDQLRPFVESLRRTSFSGDLVLLWNEVDQETRLQLERHGVKLVHMNYRGSGALNSWSRFWPTARGPLSLPVGPTVRNAVYKRILNLAFVRYLHAFDYLSARRGTYRGVLLTDVRDVIFQDDPFRDPLPGSMVAFLEDRHVVYGDEPMNDGWVSANYGPETLRTLNGHRISCCGTIMGTESGMIDYLSAFAGEIRKLRSVAHGADTSVHNVLVRETLAGRISIADNYHGAVGTINSQAEPKLVDGQILDPKFKPVPVLHQYDRLQGLTENLLARLAPDTTDP